MKTKYNVGQLVKERISESLGVIYEINDHFQSKHMTQYRVLWQDPKTNSYKNWWYAFQIVEIE